MFTNDIVAGQLARLGRYLEERVVPYHPHYRRLFAKEPASFYRFRSPRDLARLPLTTKLELGAAPRDFVLQPDPSDIRRRLRWYETVEALVRPATVQARMRRRYRPSFVVATSGRTSTSTPVLFTSEDVERFKRVYAAGAQVQGMAADDVYVSLFPYAPHLAFWIVFFAAEALGLLGVNTGATLGTLRAIGLAREMKATWIAGTPTYVLHFLERARAEGCRLEHLRGVTTGGERLSPGLRARIEAAVDDLGGRGAGAVRDGYGVVESKMACMECTPHSGYHAPPDILLWECVDPKTGAHVEPEAGGDLAFTHLTGSGTVLLRYRPGDVSEGGVSVRPCPHCGRAWPRVLGPLGRSADYCQGLQVTKIKGTTVNLNGLVDLLAAQSAVREFRVRLRKNPPDDPYGLDVLRLEVALRDDTQPGAERRLGEEVKAATEITPELVVRPYDELAADLTQALKGTRCVDERGAPSGRPV